MLSRGFLLRRFLHDADSAGVTTRVAGTLRGDTLLYVVESGGTIGDTQRVHVSSPVLLPAMVPLAAILRAPPKVGRRTTFNVFDPHTRQLRERSFEISAESLFVVDDSAAMDAGTSRFVATLKDTVRAWQLREGSDATDAPWVDAQGRVVRGTAGPLQLARTTYELSFENWRLDARTALPTAGGESAVHAASAIASSVTVPVARIRALKLRLRAPTLSGLALAGGRQQLDGDVLTIRAEAADTLTAAYTLPPTAQHRTQFRATLQAEPFLQARAPLMLRQAVQLVRTEREPLAIVERLSRWVTDSVARTATVTMPDAIQTLRMRRGDSNDHAQLFAALARSLDIPTRTVSGLLYVNGRFYYHAWAEVFLRDWVAVDPTYGQVPADAARVRLMIGGFERQPDLLRRLGTLHIDVVEAR
jgi:transglutaminase-like putative cysteine protease